MKMRHRPRVLRDESAASLRRYYEAKPPTTARLALTSSDRSR